MFDAYIVNAFTTELACGNPAGVVFYTTLSSSMLFQKIALDIGASEAAFIKNLHSNEYSIRWFSPIKEMNLCGHATLAAAKIINHNEKYNNIIFHYADGIINVVVNKDESIGMEYPYKRLCKCSH